MVRPFCSCFQSQAFDSPEPESGAQRSSLSDPSASLETSQMSNNGKMDKQIVVYTYSETLLMKRKKGRRKEREETPNNLGKSQNYYTE